MAKAGSVVIAVLTGDLVGSSNLGLDRLEQARQRVAEAVGWCDAWRPGLVMGRAQFFRGDSWQLALRDPGLSLRVAIVLRAALLSLQFKADGRIGIGVGSYERIDEGQVSLSVGDAFSCSGAALDGMGRDLRFRVEMAPGLAGRADWLPAMLGLCDELVGRLQPRQAELVWRCFGPKPPLQKDVAVQLGISPQSVSEGLASAGHSALVAAAEAVERVDWRVRPRVQLI